MALEKSTPAMDAETIRVIEYAIKRAFEAHPRPSAVTQKQAAEMLGVSQSTVSRCVKTGVIKINKMGMVPIGEVDRVLATD